MKHSDKFFEAVGTWALAKYPDRIHPDAFDFYISPVVRMPWGTGICWQLCWSTPNDQLKVIGTTTDGDTLMGMRINDLEFDMEFEDLLDEVLS